MERQTPDTHASHDLAAARSACATMLEIAPRTRFSSRPQLGAISSSRCQTIRAPIVRCDARNNLLPDEPMEGRHGDPTGGARRDRTDDLLLAKQALSQLSYGPLRDQASAIRDQASDTRLPIPDAWSWWAWEDLNFRPHAYQARALTN